MLIALLLTWETLPLGKIPSKTSLVSVGPQGFDDSEVK